MELHTIGIDLGKTIFHLVGLNARGEVLARKRFSRAQLLRFTTNRKVHLIGMEACGGAHFLGRALREQGHEVRLIPAQYVKPYVKTNKSDYIDAEAKLSGALRMLVAQLKLELDQLVLRLEEADELIKRAAQENEACRRLDAIPGIGPLAATAVIAAIGNGAAFRKGREFAAWMGVVPREHSTGGKQKLLGISKRGNRYLRTLFVHGARAVLQFKEKQSSGLKAWPAQLTSRTHRNVAVVALANKLARMAWEESVAHSILARSLLLQQRPYPFAQTNPALLFSLAIRRRTIHSGCAVISGAIHYLIGQG